MGFFTKGVEFIYLTDIRGAKILVVEDNQINQLVAREILEKEGMWVDIAENGAIAVDKIIQNQYDLVLMDLQMPIMDGYKATRSIREYGNYDLPIIALSADAMEGTKERVEEAGMNYYLTKPIESNELLGILVKWIRPGKREVYKVNDDKQEDRLNELTTKLKSFDVTAALNRILNNQESYVTILEKFMHNYSEFPDELSRMYQKRDYQGMERQLHALKGVAGNIGLNDVLMLIEGIEVKIRTGDNLVEMKEFYALKEKFVMAMKEIELLHRKEEESMRVLKRDVLLSKLEELHKLLDDYDTKAVFKMKEVKSSLLQLGYNDYTFDIETAISNYEMDKACDICNTVIETLKGGRSL